MPSQVVDGPRGTVVSVPAGALAEGVKIHIDCYDQGPSVAPFKPVSPYVVVDAATIVPSQRATSVLIPIEGQAKHPVVMVESVGRWLQVPAKSAKKDGKPALSVALDRVTFPWRMVIVEAQASASLVDSRSEGGRLTRLEQLRLVDHDRFLKEIRSINSAGDLAAGRFGGFWPAAYAAPAGAEVVRDEINKARFSFLKAQEEVDEGTRRAACDHYREGLDHLAAAKTALHGLSNAARAEKLEDWSEDGTSMVFGGEWKLEQLVQQYCGTFAPWGLEVTRGILADPSVVDRGFDVRVLPYFGQLMQVNVTLPGAGKPLPLGDQNGPLHKVLDNAQQQAAKRMKLVPEQTVTYESVQIYSPRLYDGSLSEWMMSLKSADNGLGAVIGLCILAEPASVGAAVYGAYLVVAPVIEYVFVEFQAKKLSGKGIAREATVYNINDGFKLMAAALLVPKAKSYTDLVLNLLIDFEGVRTLESVREYNHGAVGYDDNSGWFFTSKFPVPPIVLSSNVYGPRKDLVDVSFGRYGIGGWATLQFSLHYGALANSRLSGYNLSEAFKRKRAELNIPIDKNFAAASVYGTHWRPLDPSSWSFRLIDEAPNLQVVEVSLQSKQVKQWAKEAGLKVEAFLKKAEFQACIGGRWVESPNFAVREMGDFKRSLPLQKLLLEGDHKDEYRFALALAPPRAFDNSYRLHPEDMTEATVGRWAGYTLATYEPQPFKSFTFRLVVGKKEFLRFPVGFAEKAVDQPTRCSCLPSSKILVEFVTVAPKPAPPSPGRLVWHKPAIPVTELAKLRKRYGGFAMAFEVEVSFVDGRAPVVKRVDYDPSRKTTMEIEGLDIPQIKYVTERLVNRETGKYQPNIFLASGNPVWDKIMAGETFTHKWVTYKYVKKPKGESVLTIDEVYEAPAPKKPVNKGGQPVGGANPFGGAR